MSKLSKRAITLFVIATMVLSMLSAFIAVPVMAAPGDVDVDTQWLDSQDDCQWSVYTSAAGIYSLHVTFDNDVFGEGIDVIATLDPNMTLAELTEMTFWEYVVVPGGTDDLGAGITLYMDMNDDGVFDWGDDAQIVLESPYNSALVTGNLDEWVEREVADFAGFQKGPGSLEADYTGANGTAIHSTLDMWKTTAYSTYTVLQVGLVLGFGDYGFYDGYLDDITVNGDIYPLEIDFPMGDPDFTIDYVTPWDVDYGDVLTVIGSGVTSGSAVNFYWDFVTAGNLLNTTEGLPSGDFEGTVKVPSAYYGNHYIWVKDLASGISIRSDAIPVIPKIKLSPSSGLKTDDVTMKGYGFKADSDIDIDLGALSEDGDEVDDDETDELGYFEYVFEVDVIGDDTYWISATDADDNTADAKFIVGAAITLDKTVGPAGTKVKIDGRGYTDDDDITIASITLENGDSYEVATSDEDDEDLEFSDGTFSVYIIIPSASEGTYDVTVTDSNAKTASDEFEVDGETSIKVSPEYGTPGVVLTVKGYNFTQVSGTEVTLKLGERTAKATTDSSGSFEGNIVIPPSDLGKKYDVTALDERLCYAEDEVLVTIIFLQLSDLSAPVGSSVTLMGSGFTDGAEDGEWNATFGDLDLIATTPIDAGQTYFSDTFYIPSLPSGTYPIGVYDVVREITVYIDFTITEQAALSVNRVEIPNGYNLTLKGVNFAESIEGEDIFETTWWIFNSTDAWDLNDEPNVTTGEFPGGVVPVTSIEEDEEGTLTGYYMIPEFLALGSYTINCTTVSNAPSGEDWEIIQTAEVDIEIVPEEVILNIGSPSYAKAQTITFVIKATLQKDPFDLGIKDPEGGEVFNSTWELKHWKTLGSWYYIPSNLQIDKNTEWLYTLPADAMPGTWTYSFWDDSKEYANGTFQVTQLTEIEQLQVDIGEIISGIAGMGASNEELAALVADLQGASAEAVAAAAAAAAAAGDAQTAAEAAMAAISDVDDTAGDALTAANDAKDAADRAKDAADLGLQAAMDAVAKAQESVDAATDAKEAAEANKQQTGGLTTLVYGAIAASLIAALAAIVSLMQISRRIAG